MDPSGAKTRQQRKDGAYETLKGVDSGRWKRASSTVGVDYEQLACDGQKYNCEIDIAQLVLVKDGELCVIEGLGKQ